jgi:hypothetical protein
LKSSEEIILDFDEGLVEVGRTVIWKAKDGDYPVIVAGDLGTGSDGRRYIAVETAWAGIPVDELEMEPGRTR